MNSYKFKHVDTLTAVYAYELASKFSKLRELRRNEQELYCRPSLQILARTVVSNDISINEKFFYTLVFERNLPNSTTSKRIYVRIFR